MVIAADRGDFKTLLDGGCHIYSLIQNSTNKTDITFRIQMVSKMARFASTHELDI